MNNYFIKILLNFKVLVLSILHIILKLYVLLIKNKYYFRLIRIFNPIISSLYVYKG